MTGRTPALIVAHSQSAEQCSRLSESTSGLFLNSSETNLTPTSRSLNQQPSMDAEIQIVFWSGPRSKLRDIRVDVTSCTDPGQLRVLQSYEGDEVVTLKENTQESKHRYFLAPSDTDCFTRVLFHTWCKSETPTPHCANRPKLAESHHFCVTPITSDDHPAIRVQLSKRTRDLCVFNLFNFTSVWGVTPIDGKMAQRGLESESGRAVAHQYTKCIKINYYICNEYWLALAPALLPPLVLQSGMAPHGEPIRDQTTIYTDGHFYDEPPLASVWSTSRSGIVCPRPSVHFKFLSGNLLMRIFVQPGNPSITDARLDANVQDMIKDDHYFQAASLEVCGGATVSSRASYMNPISRRSAARPQGEHARTEVERIIHSWWDVSNPLNLKVTKAGIGVGTSPEGPISACFTSFCSNNPAHNFCIGRHRTFRSPPYKRREEQNENTFRSWMRKKKDKMELAKEKAIDLVTKSITQRIYRHVLKLRNSFVAPTVVQGYNGAGVCRLVQSVTLPV
ncbi:hypothetical protein CBL_01966 [Carabus blaptoides fortunei]